MYTTCSPPESAHSCAEANSTKKNAEFAMPTGKFATLRRTVSATQAPPPVRKPSSSAQLTGSPPHTVNTTAFNGATAPASQSIIAPSSGTARSTDR